MTQKKLDKLVDKMNDAINTALNKACPLTPGHHRDRNNPWYTEWMEVLRRRLERHYQKQRINPSPTNTQRFKTTQKTYKRECRKRKRRSSRQHIEWTPDSRTASKLLKSLSPGGRPGVSSFEKQDGTFILPGEETATHVLESHFPESEPAFYPHYTHKHIDMDDIVTSHEEVINPTLIREALAMFANKKTPGPDGYKPEMLQNLPDNMIDLLCIIYKSCLSLGYAQGLERM